MWLSFIVYTLFAFTMFFLVNKKHYNYLYVYKSKRNRALSFPIEIWACIFVFVLISALRYDVGVDYMSYLDKYIAATKGQLVLYRELEESYLFVTKLFSYFHIHYTLYFAFLSFLQILFVFLAFKDERKILPFMVLLIVLGGYYFTWMNGIRQMIAACSFLFTVKYITHKKPIPFLIGIIFAYSWHHSAIILLLTYIFAYEKTIWSKTTWGISIFVCCLLLGHAPFWITEITKIGDILSFIGYDYYANILDDITDSSHLRTFNLGPRMLFSIVTSLMCIYWYPKVRMHGAVKNIDLLYKLFYIGICSYALLVNTSHLFLRPVLYFTIFSLPIIAYTLSYLKDRKNYIVFALLLICSMSYTYISCISENSLPENQRISILYQFCIDK